MAFSTAEILESFFEDTEAPEVPMPGAWARSGVLNRGNRHEIPQLQREVSCVECRRPFGTVVGLITHLKLKAKGGR